jgi:hypothetical protein
MLPPISGDVDGQAESGDGDERRRSRAAVSIDVAAGDLAQRVLLEDGRAALHRAIG